MHLHIRYSEHTADTCAGGSYVPLGWPYQRLSKRIGDHARQHNLRATSTLLTWERGYQFSLTDLHTSDSLVIVYVCAVGRGPRARPTINCASARTNRTRQIRAQRRLEKFYFCKLPTILFPSSLDTMAPFYRVSLAPCYRLRLCTWCIYCRRHSGSQGYL